MIHSRIGAIALGAVTVLLASVCGAGPNTWSIKGPPGGSFRFVEASPTAANIVYAAYLRSLHRSSDGGMTWTTLRGFNGQINGIAVDPSDGNRLYVSANDEGLFRSEDGGQTFTIVAPGNAGIWGVGASSTAVYYSTGARSIHRSLDRGQTWTVRTAAPQTLTRILVDPENSDVVYGSNGPYLERSVDGGATWAQIQIGAGFSSIYQIARLSSTQLVAAVDDGLYSSENGGVTWTSRAAGTYLSVVADPRTPGRAIAGSAFGQVMATTSYGMGWSSLGQSGLGRLEGLSIDSQSAARMVVMNSQGVRFTTTTGASWSTSTEQPVASSPTQIVTTPASVSKVYTYTTSGGDGLFATSSDNGWQRLNPPGANFGQADLAVKPGTPSSLYLAAFNRGVYRSNDGGITWTAPNGDLNGFAVQAIDFDPRNTDVMYASVYNVSATPVNGLYRSLDGGATWSPHSVNLATNLFGMDLKIDRATPTRMYLAVYQGFGPANTGGLYRSTDEGVNWSQIAFTGEDVRTVAIDPSNASIIHVAATSGLQTSTDGGDSFNPNNQFAIITNQPASSVAIDPVVPTTLYATSLDPGFGAGPQKSSFVLRSVDSGQTWEVLRSGSESPAWTIAHLTLDPINPALIYVATGSHGVATFEVAPDLSVELGNHSGVRPLNAESSFTMRATNNGALAATVVRLSATLPAGLTGVSVTSDRGTCTVGATVTCTVPVLRPAQAVNAVVRYTPPAPNLLAVTATVTAHESDAIAANNSAQASAIVGEVADLAVAITPSATSVVRGSTVTYSVSVTNAGPTSASPGTITFSLGNGFTLGTPPSGCTGGATISCPMSALAAGAAQSFSFTAVATESIAAVATATVAVAATAFDPNTANNSSSASVTSMPPSSGGGSNGGGGGGGGSFEVTVLAALWLFSLARWRAPRRNMVHVGR